ncbi:hypothetical protein E8E13_004379 [Curvularia kusanoi]|uniref:Isochorismatase-like domain-containing protein n=1 Tax=Curvularia kusanoi TaxID=90978 RepID=A0A9P4TCD4_CURKU|nr:hypothetical protein E8E13_004379 [Curvularia kusanoi]
MPMASKTFSELQEEEYTSTTVGTITCTAPIPFGGEEQWLYFPDDGKFDLSRGSQRRMVVECDKERHNHSGFMFDPDSAILIVVDMQNYFVHPQYRDHAAGLKAVEPTLRVIERCRKEGIQIAWLNWGLTENDLKTMAPAIQRGFHKTLGWHVGLGAQLPGNQGRCLFKRTWNAELYDPFKKVAQPGDLFFDKTRMSGLWSTSEPLHEYLRAVDKKTLIFTGVNTDQCVFGTVSDAYSYGWDCVLLDDCTGTMTGLGAQAVAEYNIAQNMGLREAEIIPTVIDDFLPSLTLSISWKKDEAELGNTIKPKHLQSAPAIALHEDTNPGSARDSHPTYVVTLTDPDAPSRDNPKWSEMCHWIATNVSVIPRTFSILPLPEHDLVEYNLKDHSSPDDVIEYKPPGPPPETGKHRYVFLVFAPKNGTTEALHLSVPKNRQHWGTGEEGGGVRN